MKKTKINYLILAIVMFIIGGCEYEEKYDGGTISAFISNFDLRKMYKGTDVTLTTENMRGATSIKGVVVSDHSGNNLPAGLLVIQNTRSVWNIDSLRGIAIPIGAEAANYVPGDSVHVKIEGGVLKRQDGILQVTGIPANAVTKVASGRPIVVKRIPSSFILNDPASYESTLVAIVKGGFDPLPEPTDKYAGDKVLNDGFADITLHTESSATFANNTNLPILANYYGIIFTKVGEDGKLIPEHRIRTTADIQLLSSVIEIAPIIISGVMVDLEGGDGDYEYMQFKATRDINFAQTPFSVVTTNNAGATLPTGLPSLGWATGSLFKGTSGNSKTYKFNLTSGTVSKGQFFYVGGSKKLINGPNSPSISSAKWIRSFDYSKNNGDGFGFKTSGLFANSGNASGFAVFEGINVTATSAPIDVIFMKSSPSSGGGALFDAAQPTFGYPIANNDFYDKVDPMTLKSQPFFMQGTNKLSFLHNATEDQDKGFFFKFGGIYDQKLGRWKLARTQTNVDLTKASTLAEIEGIFPLKDSEGLGEDVYPTRLKEEVVVTP